MASDSTIWSRTVLDFYGNEVEILIFHLMPTKVLQLIFTRSSEVTLRDHFAEPQVQVEPTLASPPPPPSLELHLPFRTLISAETSTEPTFLQGCRLLPAFGHSSNGSQQPGVGLQFITKPQ